MPDEEITINPDDVVEVKASDLILPDQGQLSVPDSDEHAALDMAKLKCKEGESRQEHEEHRAELEYAYHTFSNRAGGGTSANPAPSGEVTQLDAHVTPQLDSE